MGRIAPQQRELLNEEQKINQDVTKVLCGLYSQVTSIAKSGWTDDNYLEEARELFKLEGKGRKLGREFCSKGVGEF